MRIVFFGNNERGCRCLEAIDAAGYEVALVVALPDDKQPSWSRNMKEVAGSLGYEVVQPGDVNDEQFVTEIVSLKPDVLVLAGYNRLIERSLIDAASEISLNLHASPLPDYRGAAPLNWMLVNGESRGAISIIAVDEGVDTGDIVAQKWFDIKPEDNYTTLLDMTLALYPPLLVATLDQIKRNKLTRISQDPTQGSFYTKRYPDDGLIHWDKLTASQVHNLVRALTLPMPGAFTFVYGPDRNPVTSRVIIERTRLLKREYRGVPGRVAARWPSGVIVVCSDRGLLIERCRSADGQLVPAQSLLPGTGYDLVSSDK